MDPFLGEIRLVGFTFAPQGWAVCDGSLLAVSQYSALFALLGTTYGGNGTQNFALPDLRGRIALGQGTGPGLPNIAPGQLGGSNNTTLTTANLPGHNHSLACSNVVGTATDPTGNIQAAVGVPGTGKPPVPILQNGYSAASAATGTMAPTSVGLTGGNQPINNMQPYLGLYYIIALQGIFPSRQ